MENQNIKNKIYQGHPIECSKEEYEKTVRNDIQDIAGEFVDAGDGMRGQIALMEVKRLDDKFDYAL